MSGQLEISSRACRLRERLTPLLCRLEVPGRGGRGGRGKRRERRERRERGEEEEGRGERRERRGGRGGRGEEEREVGHKVYKKCMRLT